jgi:hypothetical protein
MSAGVDLDGADMTEIRSGTIVLSAYRGRGIRSQSSRGKDKAKRQGGSSSVAAEYLMSRLWESFYHKVQLL